MYFIWIIFYVVDIKIHQFQIHHYQSEFILGMGIAALNLL